MYAHCLHDKTFCGYNLHPYWPVFCMRIFFAQSLVDYINKPLWTFLCLMSILIFYLHRSPWRNYLTIFSWDQPIDLIKTKEHWNSIRLSYQLYWLVYHCSSFGYFSTCTALKSVDSKEGVCDCVYCKLTKKLLHGSPITEWWKSIYIVYKKGFLVIW